MLSVSFFAHAGRSRCSSSRRRRADSWDRHDIQFNTARNRPELHPQRVPQKLMWVALTRVLYPGGGWRLPAAAGRVVPQKTAGDAGNDAATEPTLQLPRSSYGFVRFAGARLSACL